LSALEVVGARGEDRRQLIAAALRAEWRMIAAVSLRPCHDRQWFEAEIHLDPIVVKAALEQQGHPRTPAALAKLEARRRAALDACVQRVNEGLLDVDRIRDFCLAG
jgi:hypothetical protein